MRSAAPRWRPRAWCATWSASSSTCTRNLRDTVEHYEASDGGIQGQQRGTPGHERGAAQRLGGTGNQPRGTPVHQRGADHGQPGVEEPGGGARPGQRRPAKPDERHGHRHGVPGPRAARHALHARGGAALQPHPRRRGPARWPTSSSGSTTPRWPPTPSRCLRTLVPVEREVRRRRPTSVPGAAAALPHGGRPHRGRGAHLRGHHRAQADRGRPAQSEAWLSGQKAAFQAAVKGASLEASLGILVRTAVKQVGNGIRCGFYIADEAGVKLRHVAGMSDAYAECVDGFKIGADALACGLAVYTNRPVITPDVINEPLWKPWLWLTEQYGFRACWSFPLRRKARSSEAWRCISRNRARRRRATTSSPPC